MAYRVVILGIEQFYQQIYQSIQFEIYKKNIEVIACVTRDSFCSRIDGYKVLPTEILNELDFDYIISTSELPINKINQILFESYNIPKKKIIHYSVFLIPHFDFNKYANLILNPITIISNDCTAWQIYERLQLPYTSPFIGTSIPILDFSYLMKLDINELFEMCEQHVSLDKKYNIQRNQHMVVKLKNNNSIFRINAVHSNDYDLWLEKWKRRLRRSNRNNVIFIFNKDVRWGNGNKYKIVNKNIKECGANALPRSSIAF